MYRIFWTFAIGIYVKPTFCILWHTELHRSLQPHRNLFKNTVHYHTVLDITLLGDRSQKYIDWKEKLTWMVIFLNNLFILVWIKHSSLASTDFSLDLNKCYKGVVVYFYIHNMRHIVRKHTLWHLQSLKIQISFCCKHSFYGS